MSCSAAMQKTWMMKYPKCHLHLVSLSSDKEMGLTKQQKTGEENQHQTIDEWLPTHLPLTPIRLYLIHSTHARERFLCSFNFKVTSFSRQGTIWEDHFTQTQMSLRKGVFWSLNCLVTAFHATRIAFPYTEFTQSGAQRSNAPASKT